MNEICGSYNYTPYGEFMGETIENENNKGVFSYLYTQQEYLKTLHIYNYNARFYDNSIGRFYSKDKENEFPSPYLYVGNNEINYSDPTGNSVLGGILSTVLGIGAIALGFILTPQTGGLSLSLSSIGAAALSGALIGAGVSSGLYGATHMNESFNWADWGVQSAIGAGIGAISNIGIVASTSKIEYVEKSLFQRRILITSLSGAGIGGVAGLTENTLLNSYYGNDLKQNWGIALGIGAGTGFITGAWVRTKQYNKASTQVSSDINKAKAVRKSKNTNHKAKKFVIREDKNEVFLYNKNDKRYVKIRRNIKKSKINRDKDMSV